MELGLALPFTATNALGDHHLQAVAGKDLGFGIGNLAPAAVGIPVIVGYICGRPEVAGTVHIQFYIRIVRVVGIGLRIYLSVTGTIDELPGNAVEVSHHKQLVGSKLLDVQAVGLGEYLRLGNVAIQHAGRKFNVVTNGIAAQYIGRFHQFGRSVVVGAAVAGIITVGTPAGLPVAINHTVFTGIEHVFAVLEEGEFVILNAESVFVVRIGAPPATGVAEVGAAAHVTCTLVVQDPGLALEAEQRIGRVGVGAIRNEFIVPGNAGRVVGGIYEGHQLHLLLEVGGFAFHHQVAGLVHNALVGHIGHFAAGLEHQVDFLDAGVVPVVLERVAGGLDLGGEQVVLIGRLGLGLVLGALVGIGEAVAGVEGVFSVGLEGHHVVIEETGLAVGAAGPPALGVVDGLTAAEMTVLGAVPHPGLGAVAGNRLDIRRRIERIAIGVVHGEGLH